MTTDNEIMHSDYVLTYSCPDRLGVLARMANLMADNGAFITEVSQYSDPYTNRFFSRMVFDDRALDVGIDDFEERLRALALDMEINYRFRPVSHKPRIILAVSKYDHCLNVLLTKWRSGALAVDIAAVVSNHADCRGLVEWYGIPYHHLAVTADTRAVQEQQILSLIDSERAELLVLARYMQILSDDLCGKLAGRAINIHHSFLPGFKGAKPYHQAHERGVKVIGATAHFVTPELDEGPIIVQEVKAVNHTHTIEQMILMGHDLEAAALSHAVRLFSEERIVLNGDKTVVL